MKGLHLLDWVHNYEVPWLADELLIAADMDPYSLKRENRKKFQDKEKLKRRHATPSDRKYRALNKANANDTANAVDAADQTTEAAPPLESNEHRYTSELLESTEDATDEEIARLSSKMRDILVKRSQEPSASAGSHELQEGFYTRRQLEGMDVDSLNRLLFKTSEQGWSQRSTNAADPSVQRAATAAATNAKRITTDSAGSPVTSSLPPSLRPEEDFLDGML